MLSIIFTWAYIALVVLSYIGEYSNKYSFYKNFRAARVEFRDNRG
ncbi:MAG: hypothetical protein P4M11_12690 [Candidatus Pacebacteria bacterium]|nr:hypothetical protein [Candidatus Paceibacterota bacterium]